jgi:hypothetical protein
MEQSSVDYIAGKHLTQKKITRIMGRTKKRVCFIELFKKLNVIAPCQQTFTVITAACSG